MKKLYNRSAQEVLEELGSTPEGLKAEEAAQRQENSAPTS